jgi:VanZ family protein
MMFRLDRLPRWLRDIVPLVLWIGLIFFLSHQPTLLDVEEELGSLGEKILYKSAHVLAYAVLAWLWWRVLSPGRQLTGASLWAAFILTTLYGVSDEIHQSFVPGRHARLADVLFDASGALAMILLLRRVKWLRTFPEVPTFASPAGRTTETRQIFESK